MFIVDRAFYLVFSNNDLSFEGTDYNRLLYITIGCLGHQVPFVLLDNRSTLEVCLLSVDVALGFGLVNFNPFTQIVRVYDNTHRC